MRACAGLGIRSYVKKSSNVCFASMVEGRFPCMSFTCQHLNRSVLVSGKWLRLHLDSWWERLLCFDWGGELSTARGSGCKSPKQLETACDGGCVPTLVRRTQGCSPALAVGRTGVLGNRLVSRVPVVQLETVPVGGIQARAAELDSPIGDSGG